MTLKEKLRQNLTGHLSDEKTEIDVNIAEKIADEYAIEFLKWVLSPETSDLIHRLDIAGEIDENITPEQLLEIYKKEKGL